MKRLTFQVLFTLFATLISLPVMAQIKAVEPLSLTEAMLLEDPRLSQKVVFSSPDISLCRLLEEISRVTNTEFSIDSEGGASGTYVLVRFQNLTVFEAMNSLWSAVSYKNAEWLWDRIGKKGHYRYRLVRTHKALSLPLQIEAVAQKGMERLVETMLKVANAKTSDRPTLKNDLNFALMRDNELIPQFASFQWDDAYWSGMRLIGSLMSKEQTVGLLNGGNKTFTTDGMTSDLQELVKQSYHSRLPNPDQTGKTHLPKSVTFYSQGKRDYVSPMTSMIFVNYDGGGGSGILSGRALEFGLRKQIEALWHLLGESAKSTLEARKVVENSELKASVFANDPQVPIWRQIFMKIGQGANLSVCALVRSERGGQVTSPANRTLTDILRPDYVDPRTPMIKWRGEVLIASYVTWYQDTEATCSYEVVKATEKILAKTPTASELALLSGKVSNDQWEALKLHFPLLENLNGSRVTLQLGAVNNNLTRPNGVALTEQVLSALPVAVTKWKREGATAARLQVGTRLELVLQCLDKDQEWQPVDSWRLW